MVNKMKNILQRFLDIINHYSTVFFELLLFQKRQKELAMEAKNFAHHYDDVIKSIKDSDKKKLNFAAYVIQPSVEMVFSDLCWMTKNIGIPE